MENINFFRSLGFKITFYIFVVGLLPLLFGILFFFKSAEYLIQDKACNNLRLLAKTTTEEIYRFMVSCVTDMKILAESKDMRNSDISVDRKLLNMRRIQDYYKRFEDITLVDMKGHVITSTTYNYRGEWKSKRWFQEAIHGNMFVSDAHIILDPYKIVVAIAVPLTDDSGKIQAAIIGQLNMERIWEIVDDIRIGNTGFISIVNDQNCFIAHPNKENIFQHAIFDQNKQSGMVASAISYEDTLIYSTEEYTGKLYYEFPKWRIIVAQKKRDTLSDISRLKHNIVYIFMISLILIILISALVSRGIIRPIRILIHGMAKIARGDLNYEVNMQRKDEIGLLGSSFNDMIIHLNHARREIQSKTMALQDAFDKIHELNITLEEKVDIRTKELKEKQYQLIQAVKLATIGQLGASVAHEINNPLTGILGYAQFVLERLSKGELKNEEINTFVRYLQYIESGASRCKLIVQSLLRFASRSNENFETLNINMVIIDTLFLIERQLLENKITVFKNFTNGIGLVDGNALQLQQVFTNIIINAQQAMPNGGQLFITTRSKNGTVEIEFKDTGYGITEEHMERIFEPFFTTKMDWKGTGLSLSICYDIVKNHKGDILVSSKPGKGAIFTVTLPVKGHKNGSIHGNEGVSADTRC
jgi:two-component system NtrC family sensor kinase